MSGLTNIYIEKLSKIYVKNLFIGVFPIDVIPKTNKKKFSIIFNLSKHYEPGSHFIAIVKKHDAIIYFDSFGESCKHHQLRQFLSQFHIPIFYNNKKIQHDSSSFCGYYCFFFIYYCSRLNKTLEEFQNLFSPSQLKDNDTLLVKFIVKYIKKENKIL